MKFKYQRIKEENEVGTENCTGGRFGAGELMPDGLNQAPKIDSSQVVEARRTTGANKK